MPSKLFALVDCNNFYASCERVFNPALRGRPVVVLSNNDGCIVARSEEAKRLGIKMGEPLFKCRDLVKRGGVAVFSSNYALYGDMSARVMSVLGQFAPEVEIYSIDEAFLNLSGIADPESFCRELRQTVLRWTGIPVSIGLGPSKTLAKAANRLAKKNPQFMGVLGISAEQRDALLSKLEIGDVWGVGRRYTAMLERHGVRTARDFVKLPREFVRRRMTVQGVCTWLELQGISCINLERAAAPNKSVIASRSFGRPVSELAELEEAVATHISRASAKLRAKGLAASSLLVYLQTNKFIAGEPQYSASASAGLNPQSAHTPDLIRAAHKLLGEIYRPGLRFKKTGVMLSGLESAATRQLGLLEDASESARKSKVMAVMDAVNAKWGRDCLAIAACGTEKPWRMRQEKRSDRFTTVWSELPLVKAGELSPA